MEIEQIANTLKELTKEIEKLKDQPEKVEETTVEQEQEIKNIAKAYPIKGHILTKSQEIVRNDYIAALLSVFAEDGDEKLRTQRKILIYRIIASFDKELDASEYTAKSMKIDAKFWDRFMEEMSFEEKNCFLVDTILLGMYDASSKREKYKIVSEVLQISGLRQEYIKNAAEIVYAIMKQDFQRFIQLINVNLNFNYFLGYFGEDQFAEIITDIEQLKCKTGKLLVANMKISDSELIDLDRSKASSIVFGYCEFDHIRGIKSYNKPVIFENCVFNKNILMSHEATRYVPGFNMNRRKRKYTDYEENHIFIEGDNYTFYKTKFCDCESSQNLLNISKSKIVECEFSNCMGRRLPCSDLFQLEETIIEKSKFENCCMETDDESGDYVYGGIISITKGEINNCYFHNCEAYGDSTHAESIDYKMRIVQALRSKVINNEFKGCSCISYDSYVRKVQSYIIEIHGNATIEKNNKFENCESYHYQYGDRKDSHNIGKVN